MTRPSARLLGVGWLLCCLGLGAGGWTARLLAAPGVEVRQLSVPQTAKVGFTEMPSEVTGIGYPKARVPVTSRRPTFDSNPGVAAGDFDGDGLCDLFLPRRDGGSTLYRSTGNWRFVDATPGSGLRVEGRALYGAVFADVDGDHDLDLFVLSLTEASSLFLNDGKGRFTEGAFPWHTQPGGGDLSAALADINGDGSLDLYVTRYRTKALRGAIDEDLFQAMLREQVRRLRSGQPAEPEFAEKFEILPVWDGREPNFYFEEKGVADTLYLNDGKGGFKPLPQGEGGFRDESGKVVPLPADWGLVGAFYDVNNDGAPDLYVCNDFISPDRFWINDGRGNFQAIGKLNVRHASRFSMGVGFADINRDGLVDYVTADMLSRDHVRRKIQNGDLHPPPTVWGRYDTRPQYMLTALYANRGDGTFAEIGQFAGIAATDWSWAPTFLDVDLDGYEDLIITTGIEHDTTDTDMGRRINNMGFLDDQQRIRVLEMFPRLSLSNLIFRNLGGFAFEDYSQRWGFGRTNISGGLALADLDNDGDLDLVISTINAPPEVYRNESVGGRVAVRLRGRGGNTQGVGAKLSLYGGAVPVQRQEVIAGGVYTSGSDPLRVFACGTNEAGMRLEVQWRNGTRTVVEAVRANQLYVIEEAATAQPYERPKPKVMEPWFRDESGRLGHRHHETAFDDWGRQPLLPRRLSQQGPGLAWHDADGDGDEDLIIGTGAGGKLAVGESDGAGGFTLRESPVVGVDQGAVLGSPWGVLVGLSRYEWSGEAVPAAQSFSFRAGERWKLGAAVPSGEGSPGAMSLIDLDRDGQLELLLAQRVIPGQYPRGGGARVFKRVQDQWQRDEGNTQELAQSGMVSGMACGDLNGDGWPEVVVVSDWGAVQIYTNEQGRLSRWDAPVAPSALHRHPSTLSQWTGMWTSVGLGDFDGDGRLDLVCGNWGLNSKYEHTYDWEHPLRLYYGDVDGNGTVDLLESYFLKERNAYVPDRDWTSVGRAVPVLGRRIQSYRQYGQSTVASLLGELTNRVDMVEARVLAHTVFLNRQEQFEAVPLPDEAQWSVVYGLGVGDVDHDGKEDLVVSQNDFGVPLDVVRQDGGRGLWLRGQGDGRFEAVAGSESGIAVWGEGRGVALGDYDRDGRLDVAIGQNGAETKLYRNAKAAPGLRVRVRGEAGNPEGIGAVLRLGGGPARVITAGSGHYSHHATTQLLPLPGAGAPLEVRWPAGPTTTTPIPPGVREITLSPEGKREARP